MPNNHKAINSWKQTSTKVVYRNQWISVREDQVIRPDGDSGIYSVIEKSFPSVHMVAFNDQSQILCIEQVRYPIMQTSLEIPGGAAESSDLLANAQRELQEETGFIASNWEEAGHFSAAPAVLSTWSYVFIARGLQQTNLHQQQEEGITSIQFYSFPEILNLIQQGTFHDAQAIAALMIAMNYLGKFE